MTANEFLRRVGFESHKKVKGELSELCTLPLDFTPESDHRDIHIDLTLSYPEMISNPGFLKENISRLLRKAYDMGHGEGYQEGYGDS